MYESLQPLTTHITKDAQPNIVDALLTVSFMMGRRACRFLFVLQSQYSIYDSLYPFTTLITNDAKTKIVDVLLTLVSMYCPVTIC
jgi:hypothetical protein